jgi:cytochrome c peroxidase
MQRLVTMAASAALAVAVGAAAQTNAGWRESPPRGLDEYLPAPEDNPMTDAKIELGRRLFVDRRLSADQSLSCSTCHDPARAFSSDRPIAVGVHGRRGRRNAPALINRGYGSAFFWDGRAASLEEQVVAPIEDVNELGLNLDEAVERVGRDSRYADTFRRAFGRDVNRADLARALASYVRAIRSGDSPFDRFMDGQRTALRSEARLGLDVFRGKGNCATCHRGPNFTDEEFHNTGVAWNGRALADRGRGAITGVDRDLGAFKTPTLREVSRTSPYMHDGSLSRLEDVIAFYDAGGRPNPHLDPEVRPLRLAVAEKQALAAFLRTLSENKQGFDNFVEHR